MTAFPDHPFWDFSLGVYAGADVAPACLALQDRYDLDVNLLLLCCWLGRSRDRAPTRAEMARLCQAIAPWHRNVVRPLRGVRRWLKTPGQEVAADQAEALRQRVKSVELDAEHLEQLALAALADAERGDGPPIVAPQHAAAALAYYFEIVGVLPDAADRRQLVAVLAAAFPETAPDRLAALLEAPFGA